MIKWQANKETLIYSSRENPARVKAWLVEQQGADEGGRQFNRELFKTCDPARNIVFTQNPVAAADEILRNFFLYGKKWDFYMGCLKDLVLKLTATDFSKKIIIGDNFQIVERDG